MDLKPKVNIPHDLVVMCREYAKETVHGFKTGRFAQSRAVSSHGAENNIDLWTHAKVGECAAAIYLGVNPYHQMKWNPAIDDGKDHNYLGARWDVKATQANNQFLLWPVKKKHIFEEKDFDVLILVRGDAERYEMILGWTFEITGWITKSRFRSIRQTAGTGHKLTLGTWYVDISSLKPMDLFV